MIVTIDKTSEIPLIGLAFIGIITRNDNNIIQIRPTTICNMSCTFCSTDGGPNGKYDKTQFTLDLNYLLDYLKELSIYFNQELIAHIDSVGEPTTYPKLLELVKGIKEIKNFKEITLVTNGTLLTKEKIDLLEKTGLNKINLSIHSLDEKKSKELFGNQRYNVNRTIQLIKDIQKTKIELTLTPVLIPKINEEGIEDLVKFSKDQNCKIAIQMYQIHKFGRKVKTKEQNFYKFYEYLKKLEEKHKVKLRYKYKESNVNKVNPLPIKFKENEKTQLTIKSPGWLPNQMIGVSKNRSVTIVDCKDKINTSKKYTIIKNEDNIYLAK